MLLTGLVFLLILAWLAAAYNRLVRFQVQAAAAWSDVRVQLKRRHDLIPNLVDAVRGYARHEQSLFERVAAIRNRALAATAIPERVQAESELGQSLGRLLAVAEAYPDLKASANFLELQKTLAVVEDDLQLSRRYYNAVVRELNTRCRTFPSLIPARLFRVEPRAFFEISASEAVVPAVDQPR